MPYCDIREENPKSNSLARLKTLFSSKDKPIEPEKPFITHISNHFHQQTELEIENCDLVKHNHTENIEEEDHHFSFDTFPQKSLEKHYCAKDKFLEISNR